MFEIGSEFWTEIHSNGKGVYKYLPQSFSVYYTLSGRTALELIIEDCLQKRKCQSVYMPSYCCHTMIEPFLRHGIEVFFYDVVVNENGIQSLYEKNQCDIVLLIDYFGFVREETQQFARVKQAEGKIVIYDSTQSLFCDFDKENSFDYVFGSFRKWFGVNAGFAAKKEDWIISPKLQQNLEYVKERNKAFDLKSEYISNPVSVKKEDFINLFSVSEKLLEDNYSHYGTDNKSLNTLKSLDVELLRKKRIRNAKALINGLFPLQGVRVVFTNVHEGDCPLFVPILINNRREELKKFLIDKSIYFPVHWPISVLHKTNRNNIGLYESEMSCVCDQRYSISDMDTIIDSIKCFLNKNY